MDALKVGQDVWFSPGDKDPAKGQSDQPLAAKVTYVHSASTHFPTYVGAVNLTVFGKDGGTFQRTNVVVWDGSGDMPVASHAEMSSDRKLNASLAPKFPVRSADETDEAYAASVAKWQADREKYAPTPTPVHAPPPTPTPMPVPAKV